MSRSHQNITIDPAGIESYDVFNMLGEETKTVAAYTGGSPGNSTDQTTTYIYDGNGDTISMTADDPASHNETTDYIYGVDAGNGSTIASNDLLYKTEYPDAGTGAASSSASDDVFLNYNDQGETTGMTDQNGTTHAYTLDPEGRLTLDAVTTLGSGVDGTVMALGYSFNTLGLPYQQTSYSNANGTGVVNQDQDVYNGLGQLTGEYQADSGAVVTSGMSITPEVQYTYTSPTTGSLPSELIYPNGRIESFGYSNNALDTAIGRADAIINGVMHEANYTFQGLDTVITEATGDQVTLTNTLDQFGRIDEVAWVKNSNSAVLDDFQYGYDQDSNVLYEVNGVNANFSQLFSYDDLNRLTNFGLGTLNAGHTAISTVNTTPSTYSQAFTLDAVGNQTAVATNGGSAVSNTEDSKNELNDLGSNTLAYDDDGNTTTDAGGDTLTYDAWNRMVSDSLGSTSYGFDANGRRDTEKHGGTTTDLYFTTQGQDIEERQSGTVINQYVWGLDYVNDLILRDDNSTSGNLGKSGSGLGRRLYVQHDANYNVTSILSQTGMEYERLTYTPYGTVTVLNASTWAATSDAYDWLYYFQGGRLDPSTGLLRFGARDYNPMTGIWMEQDGGYWDGSDLYQADDSSPTNLTDPAGLEPSAPASQPAALQMINDGTSVPSAQLKDRTITLPGPHGKAGTGTVKVFTNSEYKTPNGQVHSHGIKISLTTDNSTCEDAYWVQFIKTVVYSGQKELPDAQYTAFLNTKTAEAIVRNTNSVYWDTLDVNSIAYDKGGGAFLRPPNNTEISIFDEPALKVDFKDAPTATSTTALTSLKSLPSPFR